MSTFTRSPDAVPATPGHQPTGERRVLMLAPDQAEARLTGMMLADLGVEVEACDTLGTLIRALERPPGAVVVTEQIAGGDGLDRLADALRAQPPWSDVRVILIASNSAPLADRVLALPGGAILLDRPVRPSALASAVRGALAARERQLEHRDAVALVRASEQRFRAIAEAAPVLLWVADQDGVTFVNRESLAFLGATVDDVRGMGWTRFVHGDDLEGHRKRFSEAFARQEPVQIEVRLRRADGEYRPLRSSAAPWRLADGRFAGFVGCAMDVTDLRQSQLALEEADRRKDEFLATLAHELKNPLAPIRYSLEYLHGNRGIDATMARNLDLIDRQVRQIDRLVDDLLEISRIALGRIDLQPERVDLASIVRAALETSAPFIEAAHHHLTVALPAEPIVLEADPSRLAQVFANLLNNAARYTDDGGRIWLEASRDGNRAVVTVRDTGIGIPAELLPEIFREFARYDRRLGGARGGLGIGLALVKRLVDLHGGSVRAESDGPGKGCQITVTLPLATAAPEVSTGSVRSPALSTAPLLRRRVLVVDDNRDTADSLSALLESMGLEVKAAYDGRSALELIQSFHPSVALLDIGMPDIDGYEVASRVRANPELEDVLLVALTGWGHPEARRKSHEAGFDHHLVKPVALDVLRALIISNELTTRSVT